MGISDGLELVSDPRFLLYPKVIGFQLLQCWFQSPREGAGELSAFNDKKLYNSLGLVCCKCSDWDNGTCKEKEGERRRYPC